MGKFTNFDKKQYTIRSVRKRLTHLECPECGRQFNADQMQNFCEDCRSSTRIVVRGRIVACPFRTSPGTSAFGGSGLKNILGKPYAR